jgi:hypothetical protein
VQALDRAWRKADGTIDPKRAVRLRPVFALAEPVFDWIRDDTVVHSVLGGRAAAAFGTMAREASLAANPGRRSAVPGDTPAALGLPNEQDARAFLSGAPTQLRAYDRLRGTDRVSWRLVPLACAFPQLWALRHRRYGTLLLATVGLWTAAGAAYAALHGGIRYAAVSAMLYAAVHLGVGLCADRIMLRAARRTAAAANRKGLYDPAEREAFLRQRGEPLSGAPVIWLATLGGPVLWWPYLGLAALATRALAG